MKTFIRNCIAQVTCAIQPTTVVESLVRDAVAAEIRRSVRYEDISSHVKELLAEKFDSQVDLDEIADGVKKSAIAVVVEQITEDIDANRIREDIEEAVTEQITEDIDAEDISKDIVETVTRNFDERTLEQSAITLLVENMQDNDVFMDQVASGVVDQLIAAYSKDTLVLAMANAFAARVAAAKDEVTQ